MYMRCPFDVAGQDHTLIITIRSAFVMALTSNLGDGAVYFAISPGKQFNAIFGGNITGRRLTGVKINPLFLDGHSEEDVRQAETTAGNNGYHGYQRKDPSIQLEVYDLRSPAHSAQGGNGKRSTVVRIGRHEVLSVSTSDRTGQTGEATADPSPSAQVSGDIRGQPNGHLPHLSKVEVKKNCESNYNNNSQTEIRTNHVDRAPVLMDDDKTNHLSTDRWTDVRTNVEGHINGAFSGDHMGSKTHTDVREVVVQFSEPVDDPVMDHPFEVADDWPALEDLVCGSPEHSHSNEEAEENTESSVDDIPVHKKSTYIKAHSISSSSYSSSSDSRNLKPILLRSHSAHDSVSDTSSSLQGENTQMRPRSKSAEQKFVKFADDTVDNENKTKRYKKERIDLREIYKGRITGNEALIAKVNPLFVDDEENGKNDHSDLYYHKEARNGQPPAPADLNIPSYMQKYLAQAPPTSSPVDPVDTIEGTPSHPDSHPTSTGTSSLDSITSPERSQGPSDSSHDSVMMEIPGYEALIRKTLAKERRKRAIKWTVITVVVVVVVVAVIGVSIHFATKSS